MNPVKEEDEELNLQVDVAANSLFLMRRTRRKMDLTRKVTHTFLCSLSMRQLFPDLSSSAD